MNRFLAALSLTSVLQSPLPSSPLAMRDFRLQFDPSGTFALTGEGWPAMSGRWTIAGSEVTLVNESGPANCAAMAARYTVSVDGARVGLDVAADDCVPRRMILDRSRWLPPGAASAMPARRIVRTPGSAKAPLRAAKPGPGDWPSFRGREASGVAEKQNLPDTWNPATGENILWRTPIPGLAH